MRGAILGTLGILSVSVVACSGTGQLNLSAPPAAPARGAGGLVLALQVPTNCAIDPTNHIIAIDKRGDYRPVSVDCGNGRVLHQIRPHHLDEDGCRPISFVNQKITDDQIANYSALQCQIQKIVGLLTHPPNGKRQHLVIFIHGGLVTQEVSLDRALSDIPLMIADHDAFKPVPDLQSGGPSETLMKADEIFPLFLNWPSGFIDTYGDSVTEYEQGTYNNGPVRHLETPLYLGNDLAEVVVRAPLDLVKSVHRFVSTEHTLPTEDQGCALDDHYGCNQIGSFERPLNQAVIYAATTPARLVTVPILDVATRAWNDMIARTRFGVEKYVDPAEYQKLFLSQQSDAINTDLRKQQEILTRGAFYLFFDAFEKATSGRSLNSACTDGAPRITVIGHSMGAMVLNELMREFPRLPYENIVDMAAASSIRDFESMTEPVLARPTCDDLRFYNLTLHQEWDAREIELDGAAPMGSLLEWIDDIFETPLTPIGRTLGKWENVIYAENEFDSRVAGRMFFHRFGLSAPDPIMHGDFAQISQSPYAGCPAIPYWEPQFWADVRTLTGDACSPTKTLVHIDEERSRQPVPEPALTQ
jgi:hypothetical protein